jgi:anti-anti-sigma factor
MELTIRSDDKDVLRLEVKGPVTQNSLASPPEPLGTLYGGEVYGRKVILGMAETSFMDSSGLGWLLGCNKRFREGSGTLVLHSVPPLVLDVIKVMRVDRVLKIADDEQAAVALTRGATP